MGIRGGNPPKVREARRTTAQVPPAEHWRYSLRIYQQLFAVSASLNRDGSENLLDGFSPARWYPSWNECRTVRGRLTFVL